MYLASFRVPRKYHAWKSSPFQPPPRRGTFFQFPSTWIRPLRILESCSILAFWLTREIRPFCPLFVAPGISWRSIEQCWIAWLVMFVQLLASRRRIRQRDLYFSGKLWLWRFICAWRFLAFAFWAKLESDELWAKVIRMESWFRVDEVTIEWLVDSRNRSQFEFESPLSAPGTPSR